MAKIETDQSSLVESAVINTVTEIFANMAFIDVIPVKDPPEVVLSKIIYIDIICPVSGCMALYLSPDFEDLLISNLYDDAETVDQMTTDDCMLELLNVLCGNFLKRHYGTDAVYEIGIPRILAGDSQIAIEDKYRQCICFDAEGSSLKVMTALPAMKK